MQFIPFRKIFQSFFIALLALFAMRASADPVTVLTPFPGGVDTGTRVLVQPDGKPIVIGSAYFGTEQFSMTRYTTGGTIDTTYGARHIGTQLEPIGSGNGEAEAAAFDSNGKLVIAGHVRSGNDRFGLARFNTDGTLDLAFGGGGSAVGIGPGDSGGYAMVIQGDGHILVGGYSIGSAGRKVFTVVRYTDVDTVDTTWASNGAYVAADSGADATVTAMVLQSDGRIVIAGNSAGGLRSQRLSTNGTLDTSWGSAGTATFSGMASAFDMAVYADNRVLFAGTAAVANGALAVLRTSANGVADASFGSSGIASTTGGQGAGGFGLILQADGKIVVSGTQPPNPTRNAVVIARFTATGALDTTFGTASSGKTIVNVSDSDTGRGIAARPGGGFYVAGSGFLPTSSVSDTELVAFTATGALDTAFNGTGFNLADLGSPSAAAYGSVLQGDGKLVAVGNICGNGPTTDAFTCGNFGKAVVVRYLADGTLDTSFNGGTGYLIVNGMTRANGVALDGAGRIVIGGTGISVIGSTNTPSMAFGRINTNGTLDTSFGSGGTLVIQATSNHEEISAIGIQPSGRIIGAGFVTPDGVHMDSIFVGVNSTGALDSGFGSGGRAVVPISTGQDEILGMAFQADGKIVGAGWAEITGGQEAFAAARVTADGQLDTSFGSPNGYVTVAFTGAARGYAVGMQGNNIVIGGKAAGSNYDFATVRLLPSGALDTTFGTGGKQTTDYSNNDNKMYALAVLSNGKIIGAGDDFGSFGVVRYNINGGLDTSFGTGGNLAIPVNFMAGGDFANSLNIGSNGNLYLAGDASNAFGVAIVQGGASGGGASATAALVSSQNPSTSGQSVTFTVTVSGSGVTPSGSVTFNDGASAIASCSALTLTTGTAQCTIASLSTGSHSITVSYAGDGNYAGATSNTVAQTVNPASTSGALALDPSSVDFGGNSMGTTSLPKTVTVTNTGTGSVTISGITVSSQFGQSNDCATLAPSASCTITLSFQPAATSGPLNSGVSVTGTLTVSSSASGSPNTAPLSGVAEKTLVSHYYQAILRRDPDGGGKSFWISESTRLVNLGANVNEIWYAMAMSFLFSSEYLAQGRDDAGFVTDLYNTFFNRPPDAGGLNFWVQQIQSGMPRGVVLVSFMFSAEFQSFTQGIFGNTAARAEVDVVGDFYRGLLSRLPDTDGFNNWVGAFRSAQCGQGDVYATAEAISSGFANGPEYSARNRTNPEYVGDLYNAFLRRGGDQQGVQFWINQLDTNAMTRNQVRQQFIATPEFSQRANAIVNQGCMH